MADRPRPRMFGDHLRAIRSRDRRRRGQARHRPTAFNRDSHSRCDHGTDAIGDLPAAVAFVLPLAPLGDELRDTLTHLFVVVCIALVGWISIRAVDLVATRYLQRSRVDIEENLLARKHVTQVRVFKRVIDTLVIVVAVSTALMSFDSVRQYGVSLFASAGAPVSSSVSRRGRC
jgi:hypothetical protein